VDTSNANFTIKQMKLFLYTEANENIRM